MTDQARTLRHLAAVAQPAAVGPDRPPTTARHVNVLSVTSGKGGVGKTHLVVNLAYALCRRGLRVMVLDADLGLANVDVLLGLAPRFNLHHVLAGEKRLREILVQGPAGMLILPASSGVQELVNLNEGQRLQLLSDLDSLAPELDILLIDTGAGISDNVMYFNMAAHHIVVVVTPEPTSITDAYALMKIMATRHAVKRFKVVMNAVANAGEANEAFRRLSLVTERFLHISLDYLGHVISDAAFSQAVRQQKPLLQLYPGSLAARSFHQLARQVVEMPDAAYVNGNIQFFWQQLLTPDPHLPPSSA